MGEAGWRLPENRGGTNWSLYITSREEPYEQSLVREIQQEHERTYKHTGTHKRKTTSTRDNQDNGRLPSNKARKWQNI